MRKNQLIFGNRALYGLSKEFGFYADLYRPTETTDLRTGKKTVSRVKFPIKRAIILPNQLLRDYAYANILKSLGQFQFGGVIDVSQRAVLIAKRFLPRGFEILDTDYFIFNHDRYGLSNITELELADYWFLTIKQVKGQPRYETFYHRMKDWVDFSEHVEVS